MTRNVRRHRRACAAASVLILAGLALGCGDRRQVLRAGLLAEAAPVAGNAAGTNAFRPAVQVVMPALVFVQVEALPRPSFGNLRIPLKPANGEAQGPSRVASGSGIVLSADGFILTNNHVVGDAAAVTVTLADNRRLDANVVGADPNTDIAVLKVDATGLSPARMGNSDSVHVGDWVLAVGFPVGLSATVTAGIVSGMGRSLGILAQEPDAAAPLEHFIQTDAAINPGNSGGPMVDLAGRLIGVNSAIASPTGYYTGYGFAIPVNIARRVADDLIRYGEVRRPFLGARVADVESADATVFQLSSIAGAELAGLDPQGPAAAAGAELGDVVVAADSIPIRTASDLVAAIARAQPGDSMGLRVVRYGRQMELGVRLGRLPSKRRQLATPAVHEGPARLGFNVIETAKGIVVAEVARYSPAMRAGIRPGQRILAVNRRSVSSGDDFETALRSLKSPLIVSLRLVDPNIGETIVNYEPEPRHRSQQ